MILGSLLSFAGSACSTTPKALHNVRPLLPLPPICRRAATGGPFILAGVLLVLSRAALNLTSYRKLYVVENQIPSHRLSERTLAQIRKELRMASLASNKYQKGTPMWLFRRTGRSLLTEHELALFPSAETRES